ncbi:hypothetical protein [Algoriphagus pacificus]|uniref:DUF1328 domain-containing protein n=1 Tax=Algoriphagus pacificus TaxID=2811234 RepID=A0ABS3CJ74_9BACT|nr:hypothetical protein [Algoriphagus pacificus]MBN7816211.1 hypothetical protein [Algoriphagus pacificus]
MKSLLFLIGILLCLGCGVGFVIGSMTEIFQIVFVLASISVLFKLFDNPQKI